MIAKLKLYRIEKQVDLKASTFPNYSSGFKLVIHHPNLTNLNKYGSNPIINLLWLIATFGNFNIIYLLDNQLVVHYSYITSKTFRFPFMSNNDIQIGPCYTHHKYRSKGIFTEILKIIISCNSKNNVWIYANLKNIASHKAFEKSGFSFHSYVSMSYITKILRTISD